MAASRSDPPPAQPLSSRIGPSRPATSPPPGRRAHAALLQHWLAEPDTHAVVRGPDGAGRTTLLRWLVDHVRSQGGHGLLLTGTDPHLEPALGMWSRLAVAAARADIEVPAMLLSPAPATTAAPGPATPSTPDPTTTGTRPTTNLSTPTDASAIQRYVLTLNLLDLLATGPAVVALDDADRMDAASLELLVQVCAAPQPLPVLIVVSLRSAEHHPDERGRRALRWLADTPRAIHLDGLDRDGIVDLVTARYGPQTHAWADAAAEQLHTLTLGAPLVLTDLLDNLGVADGLRPELPAQAGSVRWSERIVRDVAARIHRLDDEVVEVLRAIVAADGHLDAARTAAVFDRDVARELTTLVDCGWIRADARGRFTTTHPLVGLGVGQRLEHDLRGLHLAIANALRTVPRDVHDTVAVLRHLVAAGDLADPQLVSDTAGAVLRSQGQLQGAAEEATALAALWVVAANEPDAARWRSIGLRLADAHHRAGQHEQGWEVARSLLLRCLSEPTDAAATQTSERAPDDDAADADAAAPGAADDSDTADAQACALAAARLLAADHPTGTHDAETARLLIRLARWLAAGNPWQAWALASAAIIRLREASATPLAPGEDAPPLAADDADAGTVLSWEVRTSAAAGLLAEAEQALAQTRRLHPAARANLDPDIEAWVHLAWAEINRGPEANEARTERLTRIIEGADDRRARRQAATIVAVDRLTHGERRRCESAIDIVAAEDPTGAAEAGLRSMLALASGDPGAAEHAALEAFHLAERDADPMRWLRRIIQTTAVSITCDRPIAAIAPDAMHALTRFPAVAAAMSWAVAVGGDLPASAEVAPATLLSWYLDGAVHDGLRPLFLTLLGDVLWAAHVRAAEAADAIGTARAAGTAEAAGATEAVEAAAGAGGAAGVALDLVAAVATKLVRDEHLIAVEPLGTYCHGAVARPLAGLRWLLGDPDGADRAERTAAQLHRDVGLHRFALLGELDTCWRARRDDGTSAALRQRLVAVADEAAVRELTRIERRARNLLLADATAQLSPRQIEVLRALTTGAELRHIAEQLGFSHGTIRKDTLVIYRCLGVDGRREAEQVARSAGLRGAPGFAGR